jgi:hypothetical protein
MGKDLGFDLAILVVICMPLLSGWLAFDGIKNGSVQTRGGKCSRSEYPILFWMNVAFYAGGTAFLTYLTVLGACNVITLR